MNVLFRVVLIVAFMHNQAYLVIAQQSPSKWKLVWSEEFNYTGLPDSTKWSYEHGFVRNNERQYYTTRRKENAHVSNGYLTITAQKENYVNEKYKAGSTDWKHKDTLASYTSAAIITQKKASWKFGRIEVRAKIPNGLGVWPAIWMLGDNVPQLGWPHCGEIDIMEYVGHDSSVVHATVHYADPATKKHLQSGGKIAASQAYNDFHTYSIEWNATQIQFFFDDKVYHVFPVNKAGTDTNNPFQQPFYLLINFALGGSWGRAIDDKVLPQKFTVDYVRVYQQQ